MPDTKPRAQSGMQPERVVIFQCRGADLLGILHPGASDARQGVLVVVGGPQYRVGSHRQFVLLARRLAAAGIPVLRFDYRGMGDSDGDLRTFEAVQEDIRAAVDALCGQVPSLRQVVIWGLCDAASAASIYAPNDPRISGLVLLNPWVHTEAGKAKAYIRHYYVRRLMSRDFWRKLLTGGVQIRRSVTALLRFLRHASGMRSGTEATAPDADNTDPAPLPQRMLRGLSAFDGPVQLILSGNDLTAKEFLQLLAADAGWRRWSMNGRVSRFDLDAADHTFSSAEWRDQVEQWTLDWLQSR